MKLDFNIVPISIESPGCPERISLLARDTEITSIFAVGNLQILERDLVAFFCSVRCPGDLIIKTYDVARVLRDRGISVISGFHSPMEKECLAILLRGTQPIVICLARSLDNIRLKAEWRKALAEDRLLLISQFPEGNRRVSARLASIRNELVSNLADSIFIAHAGVGSNTEKLCDRTTNRGKKVMTFESDDNRNLIALGAHPITPDEVGRDLLEQDPKVQL